MDFFVYLLLPRQKGICLIRRSTDRSVELNNENNILIDNWQFCEWYYQRHEKFTSSPEIV